MAKRTRKKSATEQVQKEDRLDFIDVAVVDAAKKADEAREHDAEKIPIGKKTQWSELLVPSGKVSTAPRDPLGMLAFVVGVDGGTVRFIHRPRAGTGAPGSEYHAYDLCEMPFEEFKSRYFFDYHRPALEVAEMVKQNMRYFGASDEAFEEIQKFAPFKGDDAETIIRMTKKQPRKARPMAGDEEELINAVEDGEEGDTMAQAAAKKTTKKASAKSKKSAAAKAAPKKKAVPKKEAAASGEKKERKPRESAAAMFQELIMSGAHSDDAIFKKVQAKFGLDDSKRTYVAWYRNYLKKQGMNPPAAR